MGKSLVSCFFLTHSVAMAAEQCIQTLHLNHPFTKFNFPLLINNIIFLLV